VGARLRLQRGSSRAGVSLRPQGVKLFPLQLEVQRSESATTKLNLHGWIVPRARAPFNVGELAACVGAWLVGWIRGWALGWLALAARQLWLGRLPIDGLAWWVVVDRQAGKLSGFFLGPTNHPIPGQHIAQPFFDH